MAQIGPSHEDDVTSTSGSVLANTTAMLDEALLLLFVSDSEDEEFSRFSADSDDE